MNSVPADTASELHVRDAHDHRIGDAAPRRANRPATQPAPRRAPSQPENDGRSVYVANLPYRASEQELEDLFGGYGKVHQATIITDRRTGRSKGFGFVDMPQRAARRAVDGLHGVDFGGRDLTVRLAQPRRFGD